MPKCQFSDTYCEPCLYCASFVLERIDELKRNGEKLKPESPLSRCATILSLVRQMNQKIEEDFRSEFE